MEMEIINIKLRGGWQMSQIRKEYIYRRGGRSGGGVGQAKQIISAKCSQWLEKGKEKRKRKRKRVRPA